MENSSKRRKLCASGDGKVVIQGFLRRDPSLKMSLCLHLGKSAKKAIITNYLFPHVGRCMWGYVYLLHLKALKESKIS